MIDKIHGKFRLICEECGDMSLVEFDTFPDAVDGKKTLGWRSRKIMGAWKDICPDCTGPNNASPVGKRLNRHQLAQFLSGYCPNCNIGTLVVSQAKDGEQVEVSCGKCRKKFKVLGIDMM